MTPDDLAAIRERAHSNGLGRNLMNDCNQAIKDRRALLDHVDALTARLEAVRELHKPENKQRTNEPRLCEECAGYWPCATIQALEGDQ